ncbi:Zinc finger CCCH domain-containing protein 16 [Quillaja saponaria]|uniref:Zinc finger CCCH domain-containing protein 16 n=1 Tax=Quillaja saponaria TaxID=32244 RepID=A0AAD7LLC9_QUISA|nr:Zinc finger CCCH domain-containing protein 16 [Quillaja saponaria]
MHNKREPCRYFQRGNCQYGDRGKFLHVVQQQPKSNVFGVGEQNGSHEQQKTNPFGFGDQNGSHQQQKTNPFGFGVQIGSRQQQKNNPFGSSYEELRAAAYDDAKRGISFQSIVEERNLLSSKLAEFENLVGRLYVIQPTSLPSLGASAKFSQNTEIVVGSFSHKFWSVRYWFNTQFRFWNKADCVSKQCFCAN